MNLFLVVDVLPGLGSFFTGGAKDMVNSSKEFEGWYFNILFLAMIFVSLTEPLKLFLRKNIGYKALSIVGVIAASTVYLSYAMFIFIITYPLGADDTSDTHSIIYQLYFSKYTFFITMLFYAVLAFVVLFKGMKKYYVAKAASLRSPEGVDFRGDAVGLESLKLELKNCKQDRFWYVVEPRVSFWGCLFFTIFSPVLGFPMFLTAISFWINEWYQVCYKKERAKQSAIDMMNEIKKANELYNYSSVDSMPPSYASID